MKARRSLYEREVSIRDENAKMAFDNILLRAQVTALLEQVADATMENALLTEERDQALYDLDHMTHRLAIARGEGDRQ